MQEVLLSSSPLARLPFRETGRDGLSRSVALPMRGARSRLPTGTVFFSSLRQNVHGCVVIPVQDDSTPCADVGSHTEGFLDTGPTLAAILAGVGRVHAEHRDLMHGPIVGQPPQEPAPGRIADA